MMWLSGEISFLECDDFFTGTKVLVDLGLKATEVSFTAQDPYGLWVETLTRAQIKRVKQALKPFEVVAVHAGFGDISLLSYHPGIRKITLKEYLSNLRIAGEIGARVVVFHVGRQTLLCGKTGKRDPLAVKEEADRIMAEMVVKIDDEAGKQGVRACWEVGEDYFIPLERFDLIRKWSLKNTGICLDTAHLIRVWKEMDPSSTIKTFGMFIRQYRDILWTMHISDWQSNPSGKHRWNDHHVVGEGEIDWYEVFSTLIEIGYEGIMTMEYHPDAVRNKQHYLDNCEYIRSLVRQLGGEIR